MSNIDPADDVRVSSHRATVDSEALNRSTERAMHDSDFVTRSIEKLDGLEFPAFKHEIISHVINAGADPEVISLFETLDGYMQYDDLNQIRASFEVNVPRTSGQDLATPGRTKPSAVRTTPDTGIKEDNAVDKIVSKTKRQLT